jgi:hypothetical protein
LTFRSRCCVRRVSSVSFLIWKMSEKGEKTDKPATKKGDSKADKAEKPKVVLTPLQQLMHEVRLLRRATEAKEPRFVLRALRKLALIR